MAVPIPINEPERLLALKDYHILDTAAEPAYDDITKLAAHVCRVPIAVISLVAEARQWFKSKIGIEKCGTPRNISFCAHTILGTKPMIVNDALKDIRFAMSPLVRKSPRLRFYAGFPLINPTGHVLGSLCAIDRKPRTLTSPQLDAMKRLANQVMVSLELRRVSARLAEALEHVQALRKLIPICAWCHRIREDDGYWNKLEAYFHNHVEADFTHSICPACLKKEKSRLRRKLTPSGK